MAYRGQRPITRAPSNDWTSDSLRGARVSIAYPDRRAVRPVAGRFPPSERFERYESNGETTLGDADADVITFSGKPDSIVLTARAFNALVTLSDRLLSETHVLLVPAGTSLETRISRERVRARNAVAASNAILNVVGKWTAPPEERPRGAV